MANRMHPPNRKPVPKGIRLTGGRRKPSTTHPETGSLALLDLFPALVWRSGRDARCDYFNKAWLEFTGRRLDQELGDGWAEGVHPDDRERCVKHYLGAFKARRPFVLEYRLRHHDGGYRWIRDLGQPYRGGGGEFAGYIGGCLDLSESKLADEARRQSEQQLRRALDEREHLSRDLHDGIAQEIYAIGMGLEEAQRSANTNPDASCRRIAAAIAGLNKVIRDVRGHIAGATHFPAGKPRFRSQLQTLVRTLDGVHDVRFRVRVDRKAASRLSSSASDQVLNIVREAMSNSLRHSAGRSGLVSLQPTRAGVRVLVEDDGRGFDPRRTRSSGQGLENIAARARELSARLEVRSKPGNGTRIVLDIPAEALRGATRTRRHQAAAG